MATHNVVAIVGSLRKESFSLKIAHALARLAPASLKLEVTTLHGISFFNQDLEGTPPADWLAFREKLQKSNGVLFVTPEYNRSIPGVLKNAIDVGSRPYGKSSFLGKPVGIVSNSPGQRGQASAEHFAGYFRADSGAARNLPEWHRGCLRRQGPAQQGSAAKSVAAVHRCVYGFHREAQQIGGSAYSAKACPRT
jgi:chromate reductase